MEGNPNPRQESRAPIELRVEYKRLNRFFFDYAKNISRGGTFIRTEKPLPIGTAFLFKLFVPTLPEPLVLSGEVRWVQLPGEPPPPDALVVEEQPGMGIEFVYRTDDERRGIQRTVERMMVESLGRLIYSHLTAGRQVS
jgi:type IV pilus assembly protein PilZ